MPTRPILRVRGCSTAGSSGRTATSARSSRSTLQRATAMPGVQTRPRRATSPASWRRTNGLLKRAVRRASRMARSSRSSFSDTIYEHLRKARRWARAATWWIGAVHDRRRHRRRRQGATKTFDATLPHPVHRARAARAARRRRRVERTASSPSGAARSVRSASRRSWRARSAMPEDRVRVIVPDTGSAYGGKHTGEHAIEAARLAQGGGKAGEGRLDARRRVRLGLHATRRRHRNQGGASTRAAG